jgi:gamma-glutamyltranspeptidase/glutathione hydrolase
MPSTYLAVVTFLRVRVRAGSAIALLLASLIVCLPAWAGRAAIASAHPLATAAGEEMLRKDGNAFDASIAVAAALAVVEPYASGLGGGGFFLLHRAEDGRRVMLDARETAPGAATADMYVDAEGRMQGRRSVDGALAAGIPGTPAGLAWLAEKYGRLPLSESLAPAMRLAREGFPADARFVAAAGFRHALLRADAGAARAFLDDGQVPKPGFIVRQPALAATLESLARSGRDGFYRGEVAQRMVAGVRAGGGIWTLEDLARYAVLEREPTTFTYRTARITCASLPSSGGLVMAQSLQILERYPLPQLAPPERDHLIAEAWRRGYQDRARYLGDPGFAPPPAELRTRAYADARAASIDPSRATPSEVLDRAYPPLREGTNTTHFSIADAHGNLVAATLSVNLPFGSGAMAGDTGVLLNNEMDDFTASATAANAYRLYGTSANFVAPGKRPLSSMTPAFVEDDRGTLVLGTPGGSRIISMLMLGILAYVDTPAVDVERLVALPRFHHQYLPDRIEYEPGAFSSAWIGALQAKGHAVQEGRRRWGNMQAVYVERKTGEASAHSDPRARGGVLF